MDYVSEVLSAVNKKYADQPEFIQAVTEVLTSIKPAVQKNEALYRRHSLLERLVEPDRIVCFKVAWQDDSGKINVNTGYRVQFNNAIGPYKGGLRFHPSVNLSILKFLAFEQTFKNSLTTLSMGGAKGGSDFDPRGRSDFEIMRFCQAFMTELSRHIGSDVDVPAGDIGVGAREIGYLFGQYKKIKNAFDNGALTGKGLTYGGSLIRPEATGYGSVYFLQRVMLERGDKMDGKTFALSGFGNVAWGAAKKIIELNGKVLTVSGHDGYIYFENGMSKQAVEQMPESRLSGESKERFAERFGGKFIKGAKPWGLVKADVYMPCATQNEITLDDAKKFADMGVRYLNEAANMPTQPEAIYYLQNSGVVVCPAKASNAGGVAVSGLEMAQNSQRLSWTSEQVDKTLFAIMNGIYDQIEAAQKEYGLGSDLVAGANVAGFLKVAKAMIEQGI